MTGFRIGDEVVAEIGVGGGLAEYAIIPAARAVSRPARISPAVAADRVAEERIRTVGRLRGIWNAPRA